MKRPRNRMRATVIAVLAAVGPSLGATGCVSSLGGSGASTPGACECEGLPAVDPRVPWASSWRDIRYSPNGQAVALVGLGQGLLNATRARNSGSAEPRDGTPESDALVQGGVHVLAFRPDGTTSHFVAPYEHYEEDTAGAWSADSRYYAKVVMKDKSPNLVLCDVVDGSWHRVAALDRWTTAPPAWNPLAPEVAVVESWSTWHGAYRKAIGDPLTLADPTLAARQALERSFQDEVEPVEPAIPLARVLVADPRDGVTRERTIDEFPDNVRAMCLSWSPDGRFLLLSTWTGSGRGEDEVRLLDAATLAVLDTLPGAGPSTRAAPSWSPDGRRIAMVESGVTIVEVSAAGRFEKPQVHKAPAPILQIAWCPSGERLLLFSSLHAPDVVEFFASMAAFCCSNNAHRRIYSVWFLDPSTGEATECGDLRVINRDVSWNDAWMIPRAAEAFARWTR